MRKATRHVGCFHFVYNGGIIRSYFCPGGDFGATKQLFIHPACGALLFVNLDVLLYVKKQTLATIVEGRSCPECGHALRLASHPEHFFDPTTQEIQTYAGQEPDGEDHKWCDIEVWDLTA